MANEGKDDYQPDPKKIELFEELGRRLECQGRKRRNKKGNENGDGNDNDESKEPEDTKADYNG